MNREEIEKKIEELEERKFMLDMIDTWDSEDRILYNELSKQIRSLREQLKEKEEQLLNFIMNTKKKMAVQSVGIIQKKLNFMIII